MANPQTEKGFLRIANDLWDEILRRDFSKRQTNLLLFIWRVSYGCGSKDCVIDQYNYFELPGLYKGDIKKELKYLRECRVLNWEEATMLFSINKDYDFWQISPNKNWDKERFNQLISDNLKRKKVVSKTLTPNNGVSKTLTKTGVGVSKTLTYKLVKHELGQPSNLTAPTDTASVKTVLNTVIKDSSILIDENFRLVNDELINRSVVPATGITSQIAEDIEQIVKREWFDEPLPIIFEAIKATAREKKYAGWGWVYKKLTFWKNDHFRTVADIETASNSRYEQKGQVRTPQTKKPYENNVLEELKKREELVRQEKERQQNAGH